MQHPDDHLTAEEWQEYLERYGDDASEMPDLDDPPNRLHFDELHPLIAHAARDAWARGDYADAVDKAWMALRDEIRRRTGRTDLDGADLINQGIGETTPKLPLTDFVTETEINMHRGLVNFLRGCLFYVRNPEKHETTSPVEGDRDGAFERLAIMSLCARHVVSAAAPTAIDDAIKELSQPKFPSKRRQALDNLLKGVPVRRHPEFAAKVLEAALDANEKGDPGRVETLTLMYRHILDRSPDSSVVSASALQLAPLIAEDPTLDVALKMLTARAAGKLEERHRWKVHDLLLSEIRQGKIMEADLNGVFRDMPRLILGMTEAGRAEIIEALIKALESDDNMHVLYAYALILRIADGLPEQERDSLADVVGRRVARDPGSALGKSIRGDSPLSPLFRAAVQARADEVVDAAGTSAQALQDAVADEATP